MCGVRGSRFLQAEGGVVKGRSGRPPSGADPPPRHTTALHASAWHAGATLVGRIRRILFESGVVVWPESVGRRSCSGIVSRNDLPPTLGGNLGVLVQRPWSRRETWRVVSQRPAVTSTDVKSGTGRHKLGRTQPILGRTTGSTFAGPLPRFGRKQLDLSRIRPQPIFARVGRSCSTEPKLGQTQPGLSRIQLASGWT